MRMEHKRGHCPLRMHCMYCSISWAEATLNSEKIKPMALAIVKLCWSEGIRQLVI